MNVNAGALAALATAIAWTITAISFEYAGKRIGAFALNLLRLLLGFLFLGIYGLFRSGAFLPLDASREAWLWLGASGLVGLFVGDLFLFQAFIDIGSRIAMLIYATAPSLTALLGFLALGERIPALGLLGMALTLAGIAVVVLSRPAEDSAASAEAGRGGRARGLLFAFFAALGQAGGLILSKLGAGSMDPFAGTQIRVSAAILGFGIAVALTRSTRGLFSALRDGKAVASLSLGSFFGPFLGVSLSLLAVQLANAGVASAIMSIVPVLIIAPSALLLKERVRPREILGSLVAVAGVFLLFLA